MNEELKKKLWAVVDALRLYVVDVAEYKHIVLGLIFLKYISDSFEIQRQKLSEKFSDPKSEFFISKSLPDYEEQLEVRDHYTQANVFWVPQEARWRELHAEAKQPDIGSTIDRAMAVIEKENPTLRGKLDKLYGRSRLDRGFLGMLIERISTIGFGGIYSDRDLLVEVYEYFFEQFATAESKRGGWLYTPPQIVKVLVEILSPASGRVYDPCCGSGGMLVQSEQFVQAHGGRVDDISIYGQERNPTAWRLASMNLAIRGFAADLGKEPADIFARDQFPDLKFDYVMANPPFNLSRWGAEEYENDPRWQFGRPPTGNANYAWLQHILWKLSPDGSAGVVLPSGSMSSKAMRERQIREAIVRDDLVEVMVALPAGQLLMYSAISVCVWFLTNDKTQNGRDRRGETLFIDARALGTMKTRGRKNLTDENIAQIANTVHAWKKGKDYKDIDGFCKSSSLQEIEKNGFVLTPGLYVGAGDKAEDSASLPRKKSQLLHLQTVIEEYKQLLQDSPLEKAWQKFFEANIALLDSRYVTHIHENNIALGVTKRPDLIVVDLYGCIDFYELKRSNIKLLKFDKNHKTYYWSPEMAMAIAQISNYLQKAKENAHAYSKAIREATNVEGKEGLEVNIINPRGIIVAGSRKDLTEISMQNQFKNLQESLKEIEFLFYDEILERFENLLKKMQIN